MQGACCILRCPKKKHSIKFCRLTELSFSCWPHLYVRRLLSYGRNGKQTATASVPSQERNKCCSDRWNERLRRLNVAFWWSVSRWISLVRQNCYNLFPINSVHRELWTLTRLLICLSQWSAKFSEMRFTLFLPPLFPHTGENNSLTLFLWFTPIHVSVRCLCTFLLGIFCISLSALEIYGATYLISLYRSTCFFLLETKWTAKTCTLIANQTFNPSNLTNARCSRMRWLYYHIGLLWGRHGRAWRDSGAVS